jgi:hypothetical protein
MTNTNELTAKLKAAAQKATPGRIGDRIDGSGSIKYQCVGYDGSLVLQTDHKNMEYGFIGDNADADEEFFLACVPDAILALTEALEAAEKTSAARLEAIDRSHKMYQYERDRAEAAEKRIAELGRDVDAANARVDTKCAQLCNQDEDIEMLRQRVADLEESKANLATLYDMNLCDMLPGPQYMGPPDGGQVEPLEQVARMVEDYRQRIAELEARTLTVKLPDYVDGHTLGYGEVNHMIDLCADAMEKACHRDGIKLQIERE